jgi:hypothetical protein
VLTPLLTFRSCCRFEREKLSAKGIATRGHIVGRRRSQITYPVRAMQEVTYFTFGPETVRDSGPHPRFTAHEVLCSGPTRGSGGHELEENRRD